MYVDGLMCICLSLPPLSLAPGGGSSGPVQFADIAGASDNDLGCISKADYDVFTSSRGDSGAGMQLLVVANAGFKPEFGPGWVDGRVDVYSVGGDGLELTFLQSIAAEGVSSATLTKVAMSDGESLVLLIVGIRQAPGPLPAGPRARPLAVYDQVSKIYRWQAGSGGSAASFVLHQNLTGSEFPSVMQLHSVDNSKTTAGVQYDGSAAHQFFCGFPSGDDCRSGKDGSLVVPHLRGVTGVDVFSSDGETYLALAQSVCDQEDAECHAGAWDAPMPQPKSTLLQWNRRDGRFGDLLSVTDKTWSDLTRQRVPEQQLTEHAFPFRLSAGRAHGFRYMEAPGGRKLLLALSLSRGAVVFDFTFDLVDGLEFPSALASIPRPQNTAAVDHQELDIYEAVYVASDLGSKISVLQHAPFDWNMDAFGQAPSHCGQAGCLRYISTLSDHERQPQDRGMAGARRIKVLPMSGLCQLSVDSAVDDADSCHRLSIVSTLPQSDLLCGSLPPLAGVDATAQAPWGPALVRPQCSGIEFQIERMPLPGVQALSLSKEPSLLPSTFAGSYDAQFEVAQGSVGAARYRIRPVLAQPGPAPAGETIELSIQVQAINSAPYLAPFDIVTSQTLQNAAATDSHLSLVFARHVNDGEPALGGLPPQDISWFMTIVDAEADRVFSHPPTLSTETAPGGDMQLGLVNFPAGTTLRPGTSRLRVILCDDGPWADEATGSRNCSDPAVIRIFVRSVNLAPRFDLLESAVVLSPGVQTSVQIAANISNGEDEAYGSRSNVTAYQSVAFAVTAVHQAGAAPGGAENLFYLFERLDISPVGCMQALLWKNASLPSPLEVTARVRLQDSGGTAWGGRDSREAWLPMTLLPLSSSVLTISAPDSLSLLEAAVSSETKLEGFFELLVPFLGGSQSGSSVGCGVVGDSGGQQDQAPPSSDDSEAASEVIFEITSLSQPDLYTEAPTVSANGDLSFLLAPGRTGTSIITTILRWKNPVTDVALREKRGPESSLPHTLLIAVDALNLPPSFETSTDIITLLESEDSVSHMPGFATDISAGRPEESHQEISFIVVFYDALNLFSLPPSIARDGTLTFQVASGAMGSVNTMIKLRDEAGAQSVARNVLIRVLPIPRILSVFPLVVPLHGNVNITVTARHVHLTPPSDLSNSMASAEREHVSVFLGASECQHVAVSLPAAHTQQAEGEEVVTCTAGAGIGGLLVRLVVTQGALLRRSAGVRAFYSDVYLAGTHIDGDHAGEGFVAVGPSAGQLEAWPPTSGPGVEVLPVRVLSGGINALALLRGKLYLAGSFLHAPDPATSSTRAGAAPGRRTLGHVGAWNMGGALMPLALGLDGAVAAMCALPSRSSLVFAGSFSRAWNLQVRAAEHRSV